MRKKVERRRLKQDLESPGHDPKEEKIILLLRIENVGGKGGTNDENLWKRKEGTYNLKTNNNAKRKIHVPNFRTRRLEI